MKYTQSIDIYKMTGILGDNEVYTLNTSGIKGNIQSWSEGKFSSYELNGNLYKFYVIYIDGIYDINTNDKLISNGVEYFVRGVSKYDTDYTKNTQIEALSLM